MSVLVPPMSSVTQRGSPAAAAKWAPPTAPPASPDRIVVTGAGATEPGLPVPPFDLSMSTRPALVDRPDAVDRSSRYAVISGRT